MPSIGRRPKKRHRLNQSLENEDSLGSADVYLNLDLNASYKLNASDEFVSIERKPAKCVENVENKEGSVIIKEIDLNLDLNNAVHPTEINQSAEVNNMGTNRLSEDSNPKEREFDLNLNLSNDNQGELAGAYVSSEDTENVSNVGCFKMDAHENGIALGTLQSDHRRRGRPKGRRKFLEDTCQASNSAALIPQYTDEASIYDKQLRRITRSNAIKQTNCLESSFSTTSTVILPPSSKNPDLSGLPILDIFSIYACLRTFSMLLFLSPFEFEEFVESLRLDFPNALFDSIHVSVLRSFKKHLECLALEGSVPATDCLRSLNWNFLDDATWPIFLVECFVIHGLGSEPGFNLTALNFFKKGYHKLPASVKVEVLRYLCDEMMEMETFRSEINKKSSGSEWETETDRNGYSSISKKRRIDVNLSRASSLADEAAEDSADWNSDECILCKMDGSLICCDGCPAAYHAKCVGVANESLPDGDWYCRECFAHKNKQWKKTYNLLSGAAFLGTDFSGQLYFSCCGYLLVSDMLNSGNACKYYHRDDLMGVIEVLRTSLVKSWELLEVICRTFMIPISMSGDSGILSSVDCKSRPELSFSENCGLGILHETDVSTPISLVNHISEGSDETNHKETSELDNGFKAFPESESRKRIRRNSFTSSEFDTKNNRKFKMDRTSNGTDYVNYYSFGSTAASIVEELMVKHHDKLSEELIRTEEEVISAQMKIIFKKFRGFCLPTSLNLPNDVLRQKCGWCYFCRAATNHNECLFNLEHDASSESRTWRRNSNPIEYVDELKRSLLLLFERLRGLFRDPFQDPVYSKQWLDCVKNASDLNSFKPLLLKLEENLHRSVLSVEWWRATDSVVTMGSACYFVVNLCGRKKKVRFCDVGSNPSSSNGGLNMFWWRGGRLSRHLFSWKLLPRSILSRAARLGGFSKLPGVFYPDNSDPARRTKCTAWRASVESSFSVEHLALQIRELDANIKWDEIWNIQASCMMDKKFKKSYRHFKKALIRKKSRDGEGMKYLLDFGKRKAIPDIVSKNGIPAKDSSSDRRKYWLNESFVPSFLLKTFQPKKSSHATNRESTPKTPKKNELVYSELTPKPRSKKGLAYLFKKAENDARSIQCGHCHKDVIISEAVYCQYCKVSFHKRHVVRCGGTVPANVVYTCHRCNNGKSPKTPRSKPSNKKKACHSEDKVKDSCVRKSARLCGKRVCTFSNNKKRKRASVHKKRAVPKIPKLRKRRSVARHNVWLKGVLFSRKGNDEEIVKFREERVVDTECCLCGHLGSFPCVSCEFCGGWFHCHAFGLTKENMINVIGFRCHLCRKCGSPNCSLPPSQS